MFRWKNYFVERMFQGATFYTVNAYIFLIYTGVYIFQFVREMQKIFSAHDKNFLRRPQKKKEGKRPPFYYYLYHIFRYIPI